jgi:hypothetical protein
MGRDRGRIRHPEPAEPAQQRVGPEGDGAADRQSAERGPGDLRQVPFRELGPTFQSDRQHEEDRERVEDRLGKAKVGAGPIGDRPKNEAQDDRRKQVRSRELERRH